MTDTVTPITPVSAAQKYQTAAQLHADTIDRQKVVSEIVAQMKLRQWCVDQAVKLHCNPNMAGNVKDTAQGIFDFITDVK